jgi:hypothetical protein
VRARTAGRRRPGTAWSQRPRIRASRISLEVPLMTSLPDDPVTSTTADQGAASPAPPPQRGQEMPAAFAAQSAPPLVDHPAGARNCGTGAAACPGTAPSW